MKNRRRKGLPIGTLLMFIASAALLLNALKALGGSAQAALTYFSETYNSQVELYNIGVTLVENGQDVAYRNYGNEADGNWEESGSGLLGNMLAEGETLKLGKAYPEELTVRNSGKIDEFVRVNIYRYWVKGEKEEKCLERANEDLWIEDETATTAERLVLYYTEPLAAGEVALPFSKTLTIDGGVAKFVTKETLQVDGKTVTRTTYDYNGVEFRLEVEANAVQTHNAEDAIISAWGRDVDVHPNGKPLRLG